MKPWYITSLKSEKVVGIHKNIECHFVIEIVNFKSGNHVGKPGVTRFSFSAG